MAETSLGMRIDAIGAFHQDGEEDVAMHMVMGRNKEEDVRRRSVCPVSVSAMTCAGRSVFTCM